MSKLKVYIVHQFSHIIPSTYSLEEHKILGVYLDRDLAEQHKKKVDGRGPYIAVTKHSVRDVHSKHMAYYLNLIKDC